MKRLLLAGGLMLWSVFAAADLDSVRAAAERGDVEAQFELGELYEFGFRMPDHAIHAYAWYSIAAERGHAKAAQRRDLLKSKLDSSQLGAAQQEQAALAPKIPMVPLGPPTTSPTAESVPPPSAAPPSPPPASLPGEPSTKVPAPAQ